MARKRLTKMVPFRVTRQQVADLRRWAREDGCGNVSDVVRGFIEERRRREERRRERRESDLVVRPDHGVAA